MREFKYKPYAVSSFPLKHWGTASKNWGRIFFQLWLLHAHCITLTAKCWMNHSYRFCFPPFFLFLLYPLLCLCTVNSLLPCVSSDNELKFRGGSFTVRLAFFHYTWNPSTLRFHKKQTNKQINKTRQQQKQKHLNEGWSLQLYTQLLQLGKESLKKNPACTGFEPLTSAILVHRYRRGQGNESRTSRNFFSGFLFATAKVAYITAIIILHLSVFVLLLLLSCFVCLFVCFFFTETVMCWGFT